MKRRYLLLIFMYLSILLSPVYASENSIEDAAENIEATNVEIISDNKNLESDKDLSKASTDETKLTEETSGEDLNSETEKTKEEIAPMENPEENLEENLEEDSNKLDSKNSGDEEVEKEVKEDELKEDESKEDELKEDESKESLDTSNEKLKEEKALNTSSLMAGDEISLNSESSSMETSEVKEVSNYEELKDAIENATKGLKIRIIKSFDIPETITIGEDQEIILTAANKKQADGKWEKVEQPADYKDSGESRQREIIDKARERGEEALEIANLEKNPLPKEENIIIRRAKDFIEGSLFNVIGKLTLGTEDEAIYIDGNKQEVKTQFDDRGSIIDVSGELTLKNGTIYNSYNQHGYTGPIKVKEGGKFTMDGGRISSNTSYEEIDADYSRPYAAGAVYVDPGATFNMNNGLIDNNKGGMTGGIFLGDMYSSDNKATVNINGGIIANNGSVTRYQIGGGIASIGNTTLNVNDGIIAGNNSGVGGGVGISDQIVEMVSQSINNEKAFIPENYHERIEKYKAEANFYGGLIYKNSARTSGGGVYVDSNFANFNKSMILDNNANQFGGGVYISFPPRVQTLKNLLITENKANSGTFDLLGGGKWWWSLELSNRICAHW